MRRGFLAAIALAMLMSAEPALVTQAGVAEAQTPRMQLRQQRMQQRQQRQQRLRQPRVNPDVPPVFILPPSAAARQALQDNPGAKLLGIRRSNNNYVITLRQQGAVRRIVIPAM